MAMACVRKDRSGRMTREHAVESDGCPAGRLLSLFGNQIQTLDPSTFQGLSSLR